MISDIVRAWFRLADDALDGVVGVGSSVVKIVSKPYTIEDVNTIINEGENLQDEEP